MRSRVDLRCKYYLRALLKAQQEQIRSIIDATAWSLISLPIAFFIESSRLHTNLTEFYPLYINLIHHLMLHFLGGGGSSTIFQSVNFQPFFFFFFNFFRSNFWEKTNKKKHWNENFFFSPSRRLFHLRHLFVQRFRPTTQRLPDLWGNNTNNNM